MYSEYITPISPYINAIQIAVCNVAVPLHGFDVPRNIAHRVEGSRLGTALLIDG
jgi:hypothetical protein